jgi:hypothetical protein
MMGNIYRLDCRYPVNPAELDAPPYAVTVIFEDAKTLQKIQIFLVKTYACTYGFEPH